MKILFIHGSYQQAGGEDTVVAAEVGLLASHGHEVEVYRRSNDELNDRHFFGRLAAGFETTWSQRSFHEIKILLEKQKPDVAHIHNIFPLISPAAYYACAGARVPVVQTLHNYRLLCPAATFVRNAQTCESCLGRGIPWPAVVHACYKSSHTATAATAAMLSIHRAFGTWRQKVDVYVALTEFARRKFIEGGLPADCIAVKPNFVVGDFVAKTQPGDYALYVGRLSEEKGPQILASAWRCLREHVPLRIVGDGPLLGSISREVRDLIPHQAAPMGRCSSNEVRSMMLGAKFLIAPSICYENFPIAIAEAFACGLPVVASRVGAMAEIVEDGVNGLHFEPGNAADLAAKVAWAWNHSDEMVQMGRAARVEYEAKYQPSKNHEMLVRIYRRAMVSSEQIGVPKAARAETKGD